MEINDQKRLAFELLEQLNEWRPTILAGGAPRDWDFGEKANDLDFFVLEDFDPVEVEGNLNVTLERVGGDQYEGGEFRVYSFHVGEQEVQIIYHTDCSSAQQVIDKLACSLSKIWYERGSILRKDPWYIITRDFGVGVINPFCTERFWDKCFSLFENKNICLATTPEIGLKRIGKSVDIGV